MRLLPLLAQLLAVALGVFAQLSSGLGRDPGLRDPRSQARSSCSTTPYTLLTSCSCHWPPHTGSG